MSRHNQIKNFPNFISASMSGTNTILSAISNIQFVDNIGFQWYWSGAATGYFQVQVSADYDPNTNNSGHWVPVTVSYWNGTNQITSTQIPTTLGSPYFLQLTWQSAPWIQVSYTNQAGSGTLNGSLTAKAP